MTDNKGKRKVSWASLRGTDDCSRVRELECQAALSGKVECNKWPAPGPDQFSAWRLVRPNDLLEPGAFLVPYLLSPVQASREWSRPHVANVRFAQPARRRCCGQRSDSATRLLDRRFRGALCQARLVRGRQCGPLRVESLKHLSAIRCPCCTGIGCEVYPRA